MQTKQLFVLLSIYSGILMASDHIPLYVTLPSEPSSAGYTVTEKIDINKVHRGDTKTLKELIQESREDNKPMFPIVAYWYRSGRHTGRAYGSYKAFKELRNVVTILAQSFYYITSLPQGYFIICSDEPMEGF